MGLQLETIVSRLSLKLGGRLAHSEDSYRKIGTSEGHIDIIRKGYKPTGLLLTIQPFLLKPPMSSILKLPDFSRREPSVR